MNKIQKIKQSNRDEFEKEYVNDNGTYRHEPKYLKNFLSQAEDRIIEGLREELDKEIKSYVEEGDYAGADTLKFFRQKVGEDKEL